MSDRRRPLVRSTSETLDDWVVRPALVRLQVARGRARRASLETSRCATSRRCSCSALVEARFHAGTHELYQLPLGLRRPAEGWTAA